MRLVRIVAMLAVAMAASLALTVTASADTCTGSGYLATTTGKLQRFSLATNAVTSTSTVVGAHFDDLAVSPDAHTLYAVDSVANLVRVFDAATGAATTSVTGFSTPTAITLSPDGTRAYVADAATSPLKVVDTTTNTIIVTYSLDSISAPTDLVASPDGLLLYVTVGSELQVRSTSDGTLQKTYALAGTAQAVALSATRAYLAVNGPTSNGPFTVESALLSGLTSETLYRDLVGDPSSVAVSPDGATLYVGTMGTGNHTLLAATIGSDTLAPVGLDSVTTGLVSVAVTPDSGTVYGAALNAVVVLQRGTSTPTAVAGTEVTAISAVALCPELPAAPTAATAHSGDTTATLRWTAPTNTGGAQITGYTATAAPGGATCSTTGATTCLFTGLKNGTRYSFTVTATNPVGTSAASVASTKVTPRRDNAARVLAVGLPTITFAKRGIRIATTITVAGAGTIAQVASFKRTRYCTVSRRVTKAGTYRVRCVINTAGRDLARIRAVSYTLRSTFSPKNGLVASNSQTVRVPRRR